MLYAILGSGAKRVNSLSNHDSDVITAEWEDGRIGTARGNRNGNYNFGAVIHYEQGNEYVQIDSSGKPIYYSMLEQILLFFTNGEPIVPLQETQEIIRFIEAANESSDTGNRVSL